MNCCNDQNFENKTQIILIIFHIFPISLEDTIKKYYLDIFIQKIKINEF
jgi:hypothetical protein